MQNMVGNNSTMEVSIITYSSYILIYGCKNINYYHDNSTYQTMAELNPCSRMVEPHHNACNITRQPDAVNATPVPPFASFGTSDQLQLAKNDMLEDQLLTGHRGSACCASIQHQGRDFWLSVSHRKTKFKKRGMPDGVKPNHFSPSPTRETIAICRGSLVGQILLVGFAPEEKSRQNIFTGWNKKPLNMLGVKLWTTAQQFALLAACRKTPRTRLR